MKYPEFVKYKRIPHIAEIPELLEYPVQVYEKLDGGNSQVRLYEGIILAGNRSKFLTDKDIRFDWFQDFLRWTKGNYSFYNLPENLIVFGEWLSHHTLDYPKEVRNKFYFFDLFDIEKNGFEDYEKAKEKLSHLGIENIEHLTPIFSGKTTVSELERLTEKSQYRDGDAEGVVIKNYPKQSFAKLWTSTIKRHDQIHYSDLKRVYMAMIESGKKADQRLLKQELFDDLKNSVSLISYKQVEDYVDSHYHHLDLEVNH